MFLLFPFRKQWLAFRPYYLPYIAILAAPMQMYFPPSPHNTLNNRKHVISLCWNLTLLLHRFVVIFPHLMNFPSSDCLYKFIMTSKNVSIYNVKFCRNSAQVNELSINEQCFDVGLFSTRFQPIKNTFLKGYFHNSDVKCYLTF